MVFSDRSCAPTAITHRRGDRMVRKGTECQSRITVRSLHLASAFALNGETERAAIELAEARRLSGDDRYSSFARLKAVQYWGVPQIRALYEANYFAGLRKAGMPEE